MALDRIERASACLHVDTRTEGERLDRELIHVSSTSQP